jgi:hypothetical protein
MVRVYRYLVFVGIALLLSLFPIHPETERLRGQVKLSANSVEYVLHFERGRREWADYILLSTTKYLPAAERYLSTSFSGRSSFPIYGRDEVHYRGFRVGGTNLGDRVELEYGISEIGKPGLLFHELGHFWYGYTNGYWTPSKELNWLIEGIVSFLPVAMADSGFLQLTESEYRAILDHWGFIGHRAEKDKPVNHDFRYDVKGEFSGFFYIKTFKVQHLIYRELGAERYRRFLKALLASGSSINNEEVIDLLSEVKPADWKGLLAGWVFPGSYRRVAYEDFNDPDCDGLLSVDELFLSTDPHNVDTDGDALPDGVELDLDLNPRKADPEQRVREVTQSHGPFIDGVGDDWRILPHVFADEEEGDSSVPGFDLVRLAYNARDNLLRIAAWTKATPERRENVMFDVLIDTNFDRDTDLEFAFNLDNPAYSWAYSHSTEKSQSFAQMRSAGNEIFEIAIPLGLVGAEGFQFLPIVHDLEKRQNYDEWYDWISFDSNILLAVEKYKLTSDLWRTDSDRDGMPDGCEIRHNLNPIKADPGDVIAQFGPFIDGRDTEWSLMKGRLVEDEVGDSKSAHLDFVSIHYLVRDGSLCIMAKTAERPKGEPRVIFDVLVDANLDGKHDLEFAFLLDNPNGPWIYRMSTQKVEHAAELKSSLNNVIEASIPLKIIGSERFRILPIFHDLDGHFNYDQPGAWIEIHE